MKALSEETVGRYFVDEQGSIWRHISYCAHPTATLEHVDTTERRGGAIGSPILSGFRLLVPEEETT